MNAYALQDPARIDAVVARVEALVGTLDRYERNEVEFRFRSHGTTNPHKLAAYVEHSRGFA